MMKIVPVLYSEWKGGGRERRKRRRREITGGRRRRKRSREEIKEVREALGKGQYGIHFYAQHGHKAWHI